MRTSIIVVFLSFLCFFVLSSCNHSGDNVNENQYNNVELTEKTIGNENTQQEETKITEVVTRCPKLSDDCDIVLCVGRDENGCYFELVANEYEDYLGTTIEVGVIKENEWLIEMSTESPFLSDTGLFTTNDSVSDVRDNNCFKYIGNGCFEFDKIILNATNGKSINLREEINHNVLAKTDFGDADCNQRDNLLLITRFYSDSVYLLNTLTMEYELLPDVLNTVGTYNDGLFEVAEMDYETLKTYHYFYNTECEKVLDISEYELVSNQTLVFSDGKCTFNILNDQGSEFRITIDKTGEVLESERVN